MRRWYYSTGRCNQVICTMLRLICTILRKKFRRFAPKDSISLKRDYHCWIRDILFVSLRYLHIMRSCLCTFAKARMQCGSPWRCASPPSLPSRGAPSLKLGAVRPPIRSGGVCIFHTTLPSLCSTMCTCRGVGQCVPGYTLHLRPNPLQNILYPTSSPAVEHIPM